NIDLETTRRTCKDLGLKLSLDGSVLDVAECETVLAERRQALEVKKRAEKLIKITRARMVDKVLPNTERNLCLLLPLLTLDRYRDCRITSDYKLQIWDEQAARYVAKNIFSGGTRDQFSLALRLAFALATLPEELGTTPGFIFLDEPLSSFDSLRTQALVRLLTQGQIATNFSQIFVISHSQMFDRSAFTHHLRMENGRVAEHDFKRSARPLS
ncbi:MAG: ABC transporter ATP-binding protein, partial [Chloroflexota bacterium]